MPGPIEGRRAVVGQALVRELRVDRLGEAPRLGQVRSRGLAPDHVGMGREGQPAGDRGIQAAAEDEEPLGGALSQHEGMVPGVGVAGEEPRAVGVGSRDQDGRHVEQVGGEPGGLELLNELARGHQHFAAHVPALLGGGELVLVVDAGGARLDHRLHQLEGVEVAAEAGLGVGDDRREPVHRPAVPSEMGDLIGALERLVDAAHQGRDAVDGVETLIRIHLSRGVGVGGHLPAAGVDGGEPRRHLLDRLVPGHGSQRPDRSRIAHRAPQSLGAAAGQRVLDVERAAEPHHLRRAVAAHDAGPAGVAVPRFLNLGCASCLGHDFGLRAMVFVR